MHARQAGESDAIAYRPHFAQSGVQPIVGDVLRSEGRPLEPSTRVFMEDRFGHDFSKVRVHSERASSLVGSGAATAPSLRAADGVVQRAPIGEDDFHQPMIEAYRREHGFPPGGVDEFGNRVGPSDGEIKYILMPGASATPSVPFCPSVAVLEGKLNFDDPKVVKDYTEANCFTPESQKMPPVCQFTAAQNKLLEDSQKTACGRADRALGIINMSAEGKRMATELAGKLFESDPPTLTEVVDRLTKVRDFLKVTKVDFAGRTCGFPSCQRGAVAAVDGPGTLPIYICPTAFTQPSTLHRTVLHEALHWTGLDADPSTPEGYCSAFDCQTPCLDKEVADAWSHYIDCLGKPFTIRQDFRDKVIDSVKDLP